MRWSQANLAKKTLGSWNLVQVEDGLEAFTLRLFTQALHWKPEEVQVLISKCTERPQGPKDSRAV